MIRAEQSDVDDSYSPWLGVCEGAVRERNRRGPPSPKTILWWHLPAVDKIQGVKWAFTYAGRPLVFPAQVLILACFDPDDLACEARRCSRGCRTGVCWRCWLPQDDHSYDHGYQMCPHLEMPGHWLCVGSSDGRRIWPRIGYTQSSNQPRSIDILLNTHVSTRQHLPCWMLPK